MPQPGDESGWSRTQLRAGTLAVFLAALGVFLPWILSWPALYDADSYLHIAIARRYAQEGSLHDFPWARFSVLNEGFGDKELAFHLLLVPFAKLPDAGTGGRAALALLNALTAAVLGRFGARAAGRWWGFFLPLFVFAGSVEFTLRMLRLRPEILSLLLLLAAAVAAAGRRYRLLGAVAFAFPLSYVAPQALLGLCLLWFLAQAWDERRAEWRLLLWPALGVAVGFAVHPQFPANLTVFKLHAIDYFRYKDVLDVGPEIRSQITLNLAVLNIGWWAVLAALWRAREPSGEAPHGAGGAGTVAREARTFLVAAVALGGLYLFAMRFAIYFVPFASLALLLEIRRRGERVGRAVRLPFRGRVPAVAAFGLCLALAPVTARYVRMNLKSAGVYAADERKEGENLSRALPAGARVAASWGDAELFAFWAPQARYLNVLDPVLMAVPYPRIWRAQRALFRGEEPDPPFVTLTTLESDYIALTTAEPAAARLVERLSADPRVRRLQGGRNFLWAILPRANGPFVLDWKILPPDAPLPPDAAAVSRAGPAYPRAAAGRDVEGFVDARRVDASSPCVNFLHVEEVAEGATVTYELAPWGSAALFVDGRWVTSVRGSPEAVLGKGTALPVSFAPGRHAVTVSTCAAGQRNGFYLLERRREPHESRPDPKDVTP